MRSTHAIESNLASLDHIASPSHSFPFHKRIIPFPNCRARCTMPNTTLHQLRPSHILQYVTNGEAASSARTQLLHDAFYDHPATALAAADSANLACGLELCEILFQCLLPTSPLPLPNFHALFPGNHQATSKSSHTFYHTFSHTLQRPPSTRTEIISYINSSSHRIVPP